MSLTQEEFLTVVDLSSPDVVNVWYSNVEPLTVFGLTIPVVDNNGNNNIQLLQTVQQINLTLNGYNYTFNVISRAERTAIIPQTSQQITYYFFDVEDKIIDPSSDDAGLAPDQVILIIPGIEDVTFLGGDYDALINNVENNRTSAYIVVADRYRVLGGIGSVNPLNISAIQQSIAVKASVQDSSYYITGWKNSRYEGTKTDNQEYGGVESAVTGKTFLGSLFPLSVPVESIDQQVSSSQVIYTDYLSTGREDIPIAPTFVTSSYRVITPVIPTTLTQIDINFQGGGARRFNINVGDIIRIQPALQEYMRVTEKTPQSGFETITVTRGWNNTPIQDVYSSTSNSEIYKLTENIISTADSGPVRIYRIQDNKIQAIQAGRINIKDSQETITVDVLGQLIPG
jgi:hypothetical protein